MREQVIERLFENAGHGARREDVEAAFAAGVDECLLVAEAIHTEADDVAHPDAKIWTAECVKRLKDLRPNG